LSQELADTEGSTKNAELKPYSVVLESDQKEQAVDQNTPDSDVAQDSRSQSVGIDSDSAVPVESNEGPSQWSGDNWNMDEARVVGVSEVEEREVEEVDDQKDLGPDEV